MRSAVEWIEFEVDFIKSMKRSRKKFEGYGCQDEVDKTNRVIRKSEQSINNEVEGMFSKWNFNKLISPELSEYILGRIKSTDFFKVQKSTGVLSYKLKNIVNRKSKLTQETAKAVQELTRIAISYNTK